MIATCYSTESVLGMRVDSIFNLIHYSKVCKAQEFEHGILVGEEEGGLSQLSHDNRSPAFIVKQAAAMEERRSE